jgi:hypothetical protein
VAVHELNSPDAGIGRNESEKHTSRDKESRNVGGILKCR